jgi:cation:H+ antiporter
MSTLRQRLARGLVVKNLVLLQPLDLIISGLVVAFFVCSALINGGDVGGSIRGAVLIMAVMFLVGAAIEVIIEVLRDLPGLGTAVGFITNGPEALCLVVGLISGDIIFAASTPLGSNFMNPLMLFAAAFCAGGLAVVFRSHRAFTAATLALTMSLAGVFFLLEPRHFLAWLVAVLVVSVVLFLRRPGDPVNSDEDPVNLPRWWLVPALVLLIGAGYTLDPVVDFTAERSRAPKGLIGFVVLAALTSWPEFRSSLTLLRRQRITSAVLNITVSNLTNLWLAVIGTAVYLLAIR